MESTGHTKTSDANSKWPEVMLSITLAGFIVFVAMRTIAPEFTSTVQASVIGFF